MDKMFKLVEAGVILHEARSVVKETSNLREKGLLEGIEQRIFEPLFEVNYQEDSQFIVNKDGNEMRFKKTNIDLQDEELIQSYIEQKNTNTEKDESIPNYFDINNWCAIGDLIYKIGETELDIFGFLPEGYKIMFCPVDKETYHGSLHYRAKRIYIIGDISSLGSIITILHEVGHVKDFEKLKELKSSSLVFSNNANEKFAAEVLRKEREASLFALRKMWRELKKDEKTKKDILLYLKNLAYHSYCESELDELGRATSFTEHSQPDFDEDKSEDFAENNKAAWEKFQESEEYGDWKTSQQEGALNTNDEYTMWLAWLTNTDKYFNKDFMNKFF